MTHAKALEIQAVHTQHEIHDVSDVSTAGQRASAAERNIRIDEADWALEADPFIDNWVETIYHQTMEMRESHAAREVAGALNPEQLRKIRAIIAFLQDVEQTYHNLSRSG
jgi:hypothetical protein